MGNIRVDFRDKAGATGYAEGEMGTNFGLRISPEEAARLLVAHGNDLPWSIMAAGYGDDEDWSGLTPDDLDDEDEDGDDPALKDPEGWAPYELDGIGPLRQTFIEDVDEADERGYHVDMRRLRVRDALEVIDRWLNAVEDVPSRVRNALDRLDNVASQAYWGTCADCGDDLDEHLWHNDIDHTFTQKEV